MSNWQNYYLDDLAYYYNGKAFKPSDWKSDGVKIIRIEQINNPNGDYDYYQGVFPDNNSIDNGDLIFSWSATLKVVIWKFGKGVLNQHLFKVIPKDFVNKDYLYFLLDYNMLKLGDTSHGSTMKHIKRGELKKYNVAVPDYPVQQKIAKILSTIDGQIEKTEAIIAKYQAVKQGMLQDLFTRGIDVATGELRPRYEDAPELYKDSPLGMIPREWEVMRLGTLGGLKNGLNKDKNAFGSGRLFVSISDAFDEVLQCYRLNRVQLSDTEMNQYSLIKDDILFVRSSVKLHGVGYNTIFKNHDEPVAYSGFMIRFRIADKDAIIPDFFNLQFRSENFRRQLFKYATVSANVNINQPSLSALSIIVPFKNEQNEIANRLATINSTIEINKNEYEKYKTLKHGIMSDLLSGKVEVTV